MPESSTLVPVLCVDLDGSLLATDLLWESFAELIRSRPWELPLVVGWLAKGFASLKQELARRTMIDPATLPYHDAVIALIKSRRERGDRIVLATAANEKLARAVADYLGLFDEVLASDGTVNLRGPAKLIAIEARFGKHGFDYVGNGPEDLPIWKSAHAAIVVGPNDRLRRQVETLGGEVQIIETSSGGLDAWVKLLRLHQWAKNLLLFVPLVTSHRVTENALVLKCLTAFFAFSFGASAIYLVNDLVDLPSDRVHSRKRNRPIAAGSISIQAAMAASLVLFALALSLATAVSPSFVGTLIVYLMASISYSLIFKRYMLIDVLCLAGLYTIRILAGGAATGIEISTWLMAFAMFLFLSLAFLKRFTELITHTTENGAWLPGRGYQAIDLDMIRSVGPASGYIAVLVVCLYLNDGQSVLLYRNPRWLWLLCPVMLYWISRVWFLAQRGRMHSDPVVFALRDPTSLVAGVVVAAIIAAATLL